MDNLLFALKLSYIILINGEKAKEFIGFINSFQNIKKTAKKISAHISVFGSMFFLLLYKSLNVIESLKNSLELAYIDLLLELILFFATVLSTLIANKIVLFLYYFTLIFRKMKTEDEKDN